MKALTKLALLSLTAISLSSPALARRGADDPAGHVRQEDRAAERAAGDVRQEDRVAERRGRGADDPVPHN